MAKADRNRAKHVIKMIKSIITTVNIFTEGSKAHRNKKYFKL